MNNKKNVDDAIKALAALAAGMEGKSEAAKLRGVIIHVEAALSAGVRREAVLETIQKTLGLTMNLKTFEKNLHRIRKKQRNEKLPETPQTNQQINSGSQQLIARSDIPAPAVTSNMQVVLATKQPNPVEDIENDQNHDYNPNSWKDNMNGAARYNELHALGDEYAKEQKRLDKEKKQEQARLKRLSKI